MTWSEINCRRSVACDFLITELADHLATVRPGQAQRETGDASLFEFLDARQSRGTQRYTPTPRVDEDALTAAIASPQAQKEFDKHLREFGLDPKGAQNTKTRTALEYFAKKLKEAPA